MTVKRTAPLVLAAVLAATAASAAPTGDRLRLEGQCAADDVAISVVPDQWLSRTVAVEGSTFSVGNDGSTIKVVPACRSDSMLTIRVPSDFPVAIDFGGKGDIRFGDLRGPIVAELRGDVGLTAGHLLGGLTLDIYNGGDVHIGALDGPTRLDSYGSGDVEISRIMSPTLQTIQSGSGDMSIGSGRIGEINATTSGSGDLAVAATIEHGQVTSVGSGDITLSRVSGDLTQTQTGSGDITVRARGGGVSSETAIQQSVEAEAASAVAARLAATQEAAALQQAPSIRQGGGHARSSLSDFAHLLLVLLLLAVPVALVIGRRRRRARRAAPAGPVDPRLAAAADRFDALARRIGRIEAVVTSHEFDLHRRFREMGD
jgi:hypothetical protein